MSDLVEYCPTIFITDEPSDTDKFSSEGYIGPHARVAQAILDLLNTNDGGITVGLEGGWGSGKSTVIQILKSKLENLTNNIIVIMDTWAHQGDPLRRTFLENLINSLLDRKDPWIDPADWTDTLDEICNRKKVSKVVSFPEIGLLGKVLTLSIALIPLGLVLLRHGIEIGISSRYTGIWNLWAFFGSGLILVPTIILLLNLKNNSIWSIFAFHAEPIKTDITIQNPDPTSVEFEEYFIDLIDEALSEDRKLIIVIDNLDRINPKDALIILSTLQTFFQQGKKGKHPNLNNLWIIIPYDPHGLSSLWQVQTITRKLEEGSEADETNSLQDNHDIASSMLDKRFQIRFSVPPLVLSNWRQYLIDLLRTAFPSHEDSERYLIYDVYRSQYHADDTPPTPRDLIQFTNHIASLHLQWQDTFPLQDLAYFVSTCKHIPNYIEQLNAQIIPDTKLSRVLSPEISDNLASLWFNSPKQIARELRLRNPVSAALKKGDFPRLDQLRSAVIGFWIFIETLESSDLIDGSYNPEFTSLITYIRECYDKDHINLPDQTIQRILRKLRATLSEIDIWTVFNPSIADSLVSLFSLTKDQSILSSTLTTASKYPFGNIDVDESAILDWVSGVIIILDSAISNLQPGENDVSIQIPPSTNPNVYFSICAQLFKLSTEESLWNRFAFDISDEVLIDSLNSLIVADQTDKEFGNSISVLISHHPNLDWSKIVDAISTRLKQQNQLPPQSILGLIESLIALTEVVENVVPTIIELANQGHLLHHLHQTFTDNNWAGFAELMYLHLRSIPQVPAPSQIGNSQAGYNQLTNILQHPDQAPEVIEEFKTILIRENNAQLPLDIIQNKPEFKPFMVIILDKLQQSESSAKYFTPNFQTINWNRLLSAIGNDQFVTLLEQTTISHGYEGFIEEEFNQQNIKLYQMILDVSGTGNLKFRNFVLKYLRSINRVDWLNHLNSEDEILNLGITIYGEGKKIGLSTEFQSALLDHSIHILGGGSLPSAYIDQWSDLPYFINQEHTRTVLKRRILTSLIDKRGEFQSGFLQLYGEFLSDADILHENSETVTELFTPIIESKDKDKINWLRNFLVNNPNFLKTYQPNETVLDFKDKLSISLQGEIEEEVAEELEAISRLPGVIASDG